MEDWKRVRDGIEHEDTLVNQRMSWMWTFNGFLMAAFVLILSKFNELTGVAPASTPFVPAAGRRLSAGLLPIDDLAQIFLLVIPVLGVVLCLSVWQGITAAMGQIRVLDSWWSERVAQTKEAKHHPRLIGVSHPWFNHDKMIAHLLPGTMTIAWVALILVQLRHSLASMPQEVWTAVLLIVVGFVAYRFGKKRGERKAKQAYAERQ
jgi:hypothetical protein